MNNTPVQSSPAALDISSASVARVAVHRVGNKLREEGLHLSPTECRRTSHLDDLLLGGFLAPVARGGAPHQLTHESDIALNTVDHYSSTVFRDQNQFQHSSIAIAKHLYSCSNHPNIGGGELLVILFENLARGGVPTQALGLFRAESKDEYLEVGQLKETLQLRERSGISLSRLQKGALVLPSEHEVLTIDMLGQKTKYWIESFLKASPSQSPQADARAAGYLLKSVSAKVVTADAAFEFGREVRELLSQSNTVTFGDIQNLSTEYIGRKETAAIVSVAMLRHPSSLDKRGRIDTKTLSRHAKDVVSRTRIANGVSVVVSSGEATVQSISTRQTKFGVRATVDIKLRDK